MAEERAANEAFVSLLEFVKETDRALQLSMIGISELTAYGRMAEVLYKKKLEMEEEIKIAKAIQALADAEVAQGFPLLIAHSAVALWAALESTIPRFVASWFFLHPEVLKSEKLSRIKIPVSIYESLSRDDLLMEIVEEIERSIHAPMRQGIGRFEALLDVIDLSGPVDETTKRDLFELSQVRNLVVHRARIVDARFRAACPWVEATTGNRLALELDDFARYRKGVMEYTIKILERF